MAGAESGMLTPPGLPPGVLGVKMTEAGSKKKMKQVVVLPGSKMPKATAPRKFPGNFAPHKLCYHFSKTGTCKKGSGCNFAHGLEELHGESRSKIDKMMGVHGDDADATTDAGLSDSPGSFGQGSPQVNSLGMSAAAVPFEPKPRAIPMLPPGCLDATRSATLPKACHTLSTLPIARADMLPQSAPEFSTYEDHFSLRGRAMPQPLEFDAYSPSVRWSGMTPKTSETKMTMMTSPKHIVVLNSRLHLGENSFVPTPSSKTCPVVVQAAATPSGGSTQAVLRPLRRNSGVDPSSPITVVKRMPSLKTQAPISRTTFLFARSLSKQIEMGPPGLDFTAPTPTSRAKVQGLVYPHPGRLTAKPVKLQGAEVDDEPESTHPSA